MTAPTNVRLARFALHVLAILDAAEDDWSADTIEEIALAADACGLLDSTAAGFKINEEYLK